MHRPMHRAILPIIVAVTCVLLVLGAAHMLARAQTAIAHKRAIHVSGDADFATGYALQRARVRAIAKWYEARHGHDHHEAQTLREMVLGADRALIAGDVELMRWWHEQLRAVVPPAAMTL